MWLRACRGNNEALAVVSAGTVRSGTTAITDINLYKIQCYSNSFLDN